MLENNIDRRVRDNQVDNGGNHGVRRGLAHSGGTPAGIDTGTASGDGDQHGEHQRLQQADSDMGKAQCGLALDHVLNRCDTHAAGHDSAADDAQ